MHKLVRAGIALALVACGDSDPVSQPPPDPGLRGGTVYEIFVRSFADSDGDGVGDLRGLTARLDYLNDGDPDTATDLGVQGVWLMPIFPSPSYHGYDVSDYRGINPAYGTLEDFDAFVAAAHQRGIAVIIDMVLNHSSTRHPWFVEASAGAGAARRDFYTWSAEQPRWTRPWDSTNPWYLRGDAWYYGVFCDCMPDLNLENPAVEAELVDAMKFWLARGVDGFRLDAVRYFYENGAGQQSDQPENHGFLARVRAALAAEHPDHVLVAEAWAALEIQARYRENQAHLAFSFDLSDALKAAAAGGDASPVINILARSEAAFPDRGFEAPFLSNHDQVRVMRALVNQPAPARVAAAALFAMPGTPFLYYGEEIGMLGGPGGADENKRTAFRWNGTAPGFGFTTGTPWRSFDEPAGVDVAAQQADPGSLWNLYRSLIALRRNHLALHAGAAIRPMVTGGGSGILALLREDADGERVLFVANFAAAPSGAFTVDLAGAPRLLLAEGLAAPPGSSAGRLSFADLPARGFAFVALD